MTGKGISNGDTCLGSVGHVGVTMKDTFVLVLWCWNACKPECGEFSLC